MWLKSNETLLQKKSKKVKQKKQKNKKQSKINRISIRKKRQLHFLPYQLSLYLLEISFNSKINRSGNIGGRCHLETEKLVPCFPVSYPIAINETVR